MKKIICGFFSLLFIFVGCTAFLDSSKKIENPIWTAALAFIIAFIFLYFGFLRKKKEKAIASHQDIIIEQKTNKPTNIQSTINPDDEKSIICSVLTSDADSAYQQISELKTISCLATQEEKETKVKDIVQKNLSFLVDKALEDGVLTTEEEDNIYSLINKAGIKEIPDSEKNRLMKASFIRDLLNGTPRQSPCSQPSTIALNKNEKFIWAWENVTFSEVQTFKNFVGGSRGIGVRVAKGLYFRFGNYRGHTESTDKVVKQGTGIVALTNKNIYINVGIARKFSLEKTIDIKPCEDGVFIQFDGRQKPIILQTSDAWFMANCILNAQNW